MQSFSKVSECKLFKKYSQKAICIAIWKFELLCKLKSGCSNIQNKPVSAICWACLSLSTMHPLHLLFNVRKLLIERTQIHWQLKGFGYWHPLPTVPKTCDRYCKVKLLNVKDKLINLTILLVVWPLCTCVFHLNRERDVASDVTLLLGTQEQCSHHP